MTSNSDCKPPTTMGVFRSLEWPIQAGLGLLAEVTHNLRIDASSSPEIQAACRRYTAQQGGKDGNGRAVQTKRDGKGGNGRAVQT